MLIGYARVSTQDQNLDLQIAALKLLVARKSLMTRSAVAGRTSRTGQDAAEMLREEILWWCGSSIDWGAASSNWSIWSEVYTRRVSSLKASRMPSTLARHQGVSFSMSWPALPKMERELTVERTRAGLAAARPADAKGGRKRKMTDSKVESAKKLLAGGTPPKDVAKNLGVSVPTLYRWVPASVLP